MSKLMTPASRMLRWLVPVLAVAFVLAVLAMPVSAQDGAQAIPEGGSGATWWQLITGAWVALWQWLLGTQRDLQRQMVEAIRGLKSGSTAAGPVALITASFLYGVFHAAGPGHGKGVISSYVLANRATLRRGIVLSFLSALMQAISALVIVGTAIILLKRTGMELQFKIIPYFETVSSALIALAGLWLLIAHLRRRYRRPARIVAMHAVGADVAGQDLNHDHVHGENCSCGHSHMPDAATLARKLSLREALAVIFAVGIRPCTGAIGALLFAWQINLLWAGVVSTFVMALGTAITVAALAALAVGSRDQAARFATSRWTGHIYNAATIVGCLLVMLVGIGLFWDSMGPQRPF